MQIVLEFDDDQAARVIDGIAYWAGYQDMVEVVDDQGSRLEPNPVPKEDFVQFVARQFAIQTVANWEAQVAAKAADEKAKSEVG